MICALTARRIESGQTEEFLDAFSQGPENFPDEVREKFRAVYACRDVNDENVILTFGLFDGTIEEMRALQTRGERGEQLDRIEPMVEEVLFDSSFEVLHEYVSEMATH